MGLIFRDFGYFFVKFVLKGTSNGELLFFEVDDLVGKDIFFVVTKRRSVKNMSKNYPRK